ncbi:hypothetical protein ES702_04962 [subsurface metagenome]
MIKIKYKDVDLNIKVMTLPTVQVKDTDVVTSANIHLSRIRKYAANSLITGLSPEKIKTYVQIMNDSISTYMEVVRFSSQRAAQIRAGVPSYKIASRVDQPKIEPKVTDTRLKPTSAGSSKVDEAINVPLNPQDAKITMEGNIKTNIHTEDLGTISGLSLTYYDQPNEMLGVLSETSIVRQNTIDYLKRGTSGLKTVKHEAGGVVPAVSNKLLPVLLIGLVAFMVLK